MLKGSSARFYSFLTLRFVLKHECPISFSCQTHLPPLGRFVTDNVALLTNKHSYPNKRLKYFIGIFALQIHFEVLPWRISTLSLQKIISQKTFNAKVPSCEYLISLFSWNLNISRRHIVVKHQLFPHLLVVSRRIFPSSKMELFIVAPQIRIDLALCAAITKIFSYFCVALFPTMDGIM